MSTAKGKKQEEQGGVTPPEVFAIHAPLRATHSQSQKSGNSAECRVHALSPSSALFWLMKSIFPWLMRVALVVRPTLPQGSPIDVL